MISILITFLLIAKCSWCLPLDQFYPFGPDQNDRILDSSSSFPLSINRYFNFDSVSRRELHIRSNGIITFTSLNFTQSTSTSTPTPLPIQDLDFIAPYWFDGLLDACDDSFTETYFANETAAVNDSSSAGCRYNSTVYYGYRYSFPPLDRAAREIRATFADARRDSFYILYVFVVTWVIIDTNDTLPEPKENVFQCVLAYGGSNSYVIFNYADGLSELTDGSNTVPVQAGINAAFRPTANFISIPSTLNISTTSNVGIPGVWMFQANTRPFARPFLPINVTINTTDEQIVGQSLTLECRIRRIEEIDSTFDIVWTVQRRSEVRSVKNISGNLITDYTDFYTISELRGSDDFSYYTCDVIVNFNSSHRLNTTAEFVLNNLTQPPELIISPKQSPLRVTVGGHLPIYCTAVRGVPVPQVQWHSEGFPVYPSTRFYQQIYIVPTDSPHTTTYTCVETRYLNDGREVSELRVNVTVIVEEACPSLRAPRRGELTITEDGQLAFFSCNRGFSIRGSNILKCRNGKWDSSPPSCHSISRFCRQRCNF